MQKVYSQNTNAATKAKWNRMCANRGWVSSTKYLKVGFADWWLRKNEDGYLGIVAQTTYHSESTLDDMYKHNFSNWGK